MLKIGPTTIKILQKIAAPNIAAKIRENASQPFEMLAALAKLTNTARDISKELTPERSNLTEHLSKWRIIVDSDAVQNTLKEFDLASAPQYVDPEFPLASGMKFGGGHPAHTLFDRTSFTKILRDLPLYHIESTEDAKAIFKIERHHQSATVRYRCAHIAEVIKSKQKA